MHEKEKLLKVGFDVDVKAQKFTRDIAYATIESSNYRHNPYDKAKFEVSAHNFIDMSEDGYGVSILNDCDNDTLLIKVNPVGPVCHTGADTCWNEENENPIMFLTELQKFIKKRYQEQPEGSYTTSLFKEGLSRMTQKVGEEAVELVIESMKGDNDRLIYEASDMIYHLIVLLTSKGLSIEDIASELITRHDPNWHKH